jgi:uncharacterized protein (DUF58 family)
MDKAEPDRQWMKRVDWGRLAPLRLRARSVAEGVYAGGHRSARRGPGVEFGGHRPYVPGDDLRWIDRHALMRHDRLIVREFETETDRALYLLVDATASMGFRGKGAASAKVAFAALIAASLARVALASGDPVSLGWVGGDGARSVPPTSGGEAFERIVRALSSIKATGDSMRDGGQFDRAIARIARRARRGAVIVLLSDLIDLPSGAHDQFAALATAGRRLVAAQVLDPEELRLPYEGTVRLRALEGNTVVETDPSVTRTRYLAALDELSARWARPLSARGGGLVRAATDQDPVDVVRRVLRAVAGGVS